MARIGREFADNAERSGGRSMILMGAGTNHWFHSDTTYRAMLALTTLTGCQGVNGGGWAHYVGQEKCRPVTGWSHLAFALDWVRPPRQMIGTAFWYLHTDQWRYDQYTADVLTSPLAKGEFAGRHTADLLAKSARLGWMPSMPTFDRNPLDVADEALAAEPGQPGGPRRPGTGRRPARVRVHRPGRAAELAPGADRVAGQPARLVGEGQRILPAAPARHRCLPARGGGPGGETSNDVVWHDEAPEGKLDLLLSLDFRMTSTTLFSDVVLPAATWYEKHDLNTTDMHPFIHAFTPAINPPWQTRTDFDAFHGIAKVFSELAGPRLGVRKDLVAAPLLHDTPDALATPDGIVRDWKAGEAEAVPGRTMPKFVVVERDYGAVAAKMGALGPLLDRLGTTTKAVTVDVNPEIEFLRKVNGTVRGGVADGRPRLDTDIRACEAILALSGTTNGRVATEGFEFLERRTGQQLADLAREHEGKQIRFADTQSRPVPVITSPEWSGSEHGGRRYSPFTINVERLKPWHTLTGRQHFYLDHDWMQELGEELPVFRPPLDMHKLFGEPRLGRNGELELTVRYLTPHSKWSIHSEYQDNLIMLTLSRGGPTMWMSRGRRREDRRDRQRLDRGGQPQRRRGLPGRRHAQDARGHRLHVPRAGARDRRAEERDERASRRHPQLADPTADQTEPHHRRVRAAVVRVQLPRPDRQPARRGHRHPPPVAGCGVLMTPIRACESADESHGADVDGDEPRQVHRLPHLLGHLQAGLDEPFRGRVRRGSTTSSPGPGRAIRAPTRTRSAGRAAGCGPEPGGSSPAPAGGSSGC